MCLRCDGFTIEEVRHRLHQQVLEHGFALVPVDGRGGGWTYTIGLIDGWNHPELVVVGVPLDRAVTVLEAVGRAVTRGSRFGGGGEAWLCGEAFEHEELVGFLEVHPRHVRSGLMNLWFDYYAAACRRELDLAVLQIVLPDDGYCYTHQTSQPRLDTDRHVPLRPNRAERRRALRHERRRGRSP